MKNIFFDNSNSNVDNYDFNKIKIFALGGLGEIGKNCYIFEESNGLIIVDCGIKFSNDNLTDGCIPNFSYLEKKQKKIKALFITHAHEDHIGAISFLLNIIPNISVYGSEFSISLLKQKLIKSKKSYKLNIFRDNTVISTAGFIISFFRVTHSIPGSFGLIIESNERNFRAVLTGDFKFDWTEIGEKADIFKLVEVGKKGVTLLLSDSTNAEVEGNTPSESKVVKVLENIINEASGRIIITSFASNVYRLKKVIEIAKKNNRKIVLLGSSLLRMMKAIQKSSLWKIESSMFLSSSEMNKIEKNKVIIFCTGSQGEEKAVLSRLANQSYPDLKIEVSDSIILTSSPIMDNKRDIQRISNKLFALGAKIFENNKETLLHSSGHASQEDLKLMLEMVNPEYFMPFHGDYRMLKCHSNIAIDKGMKKDKIFVCSNGDILEFFDSKFSFLSNKGNKFIDVSPIYVSDGEIISGETLHRNLTERRIMSMFGIIVIIFFWNFKRNQMGDYPYIFTYGFISMKENEIMINDWRAKISKFIIGEIFRDKKKFSDNDFWKRKLNFYIKDNLISSLNKSPLMKFIFE